VAVWGSEGNVVKTIETKTAKPLTLNTGLQTSCDHFGGQWVLSPDWTGKPRSNSVVHPSGAIAGRPNGRGLVIGRIRIADLKLSARFDRHRGQAGKASQQATGTRTGHRS